MLAKRTVVATLATVMVTGGAVALGGCADLQPVPIEGETRDGQFATANVGVPDDDDAIAVTNDETGANSTDGRNDGRKGLGSDGLEDDAEDSATDGSGKLGKANQTGKTDGNETVVAPTKGQGDGITDSKSDATEDDAVSVTASKGNPATKVERFLSFRYDQVGCEYPSSAGTPSATGGSPYVTSYLPAVVAFYGGKAYAVELSVAYESGKDSPTPREIRDEATWLSDAVRREVVRTVGLGVKKKGKLEDAIMEALRPRKSEKAGETDGRPTITELDVYNMFEVTAVMSYDETDTRITYMPKTDE